MDLDPNPYSLEVRKKGSKFVVGNKNYAAVSSGHNGELGPPMDNPIPTTKCISSDGELEQSDSRHCRKDPSTSSTLALSSQSSKQRGEQCSKTNAQSIVSISVNNWLHSRIQEDRSTGSRDNEGSDNYNHKYSEIDPWKLAPSPITEHTYADTQDNEGLSIYDHEHSKTYPWKDSSIADSYPTIPNSNIQEHSSVGLGNYNHNSDLMSPDSITSPFQEPDGQSKQIDAQHTQGSSDLLANAGDRGCLIPNTVITKTERVDYAEDLMQSIRSRVLRTCKVRHPTKLGLYLCIRCNVREFMEKQFAGSNKSLGRVITISGTATCGQATTCSDYISSNWPLRGLWLLDILQDTFDGTKSNAEGRNSDLQIDEIGIATTSVLVVKFIGSKEAAIDVVQLLTWFGAAFQVSSSDQLQYSESKLCISLGWKENVIRGYDYHLRVRYYQSPVSPVCGGICWLSLFNNPVIAQGFPVPERSNSERGIELPVELMATLGGGRHAVEFEGGLVIKGHSIAFVPVKQYEDSIQWHMISNSDGTRLRYSDLKIHRALQNEVNYESISNKRAILGWSRVAQTFLGTAGLNYEGIDWSEAKEAGRSTRLSGGGLGFQSNLIGQLNFALGAKDGRLLLSQNGPLEKIVDLAEKTPVVLYDHHDRRAWLVPALEVILHVIHTRACLNLYKLDRSKTKISYSDETAKISNQAARRAVMTSKDQQLYEGTSPGGKAYYVRDATLDIWSLLERMMERDAVITSAPGVAVHGTMRDKLYGWEFRALVEDKSSFRQKEQVLKKSNGGWINLVDDTDTIVLFGNGFGEVIKPVCGSLDLCSAWKVLPKGRDYLAVGCPMLETLYNEAGSRKTRSFLTSQHLQWHRGSTLFERCEEMSGCACDRLQQLVYDSRTTFRRVKPPDELPENGCVIFGRTYHPLMPAKGTCAKKRTIYSVPNIPLPETKLTEPESPAYLPTTSLDSRPVMDQMSDRNDLSSVFDRSSSSSTTDSQSESELRMLSLKRRRKVRDQDACGGKASLGGRQKIHSSTQSLLQGALKTPTKITKNTSSDLQNKDKNEVRSFPPGDKDPLGQAPRTPLW